MVRSALADRTFLQRAEIDAGVPSIPLSQIRSRRRLGRTHPGDVPIPGMAPSASVATPRSRRGEEKMVALATNAWPVYEIGRASCRERVEISVVAVALKKK